MSERITNVDIDDVLSSIRRLVAEVGRDGAASRPAPSVPVGDVPEKLLLTPKLRVDELESKAPASSHPVVEHADVQAELPLSASDAAAPVLVLRPDQCISGSSVADKEVGDSLEATVARIESRLTAGSADNDWEPDGSEATTDEPGWQTAAFVAAARSRQLSSAVSSNDDEAPELEPTTQALNSTVEEIDPSVILSDMAETPEDTILSAVVTEAFDSKRAEAEKPQMTGETFIAQPRPHRWTSEIERRMAPAAPALEEEIKDYGEELAAPRAAESGDLYQMGVQEQTFDEATLRRIVQEVVREELQGDLGERITRNVRKLVRREIHNILTTQEFE